MKNRTELIKKLYSQSERFFVSYNLKREDI